MTNELEKQFFDTFGIEAREFKSCDVGTFCPYPEKECRTDTCPYYRTYKVDYPAISDHILLELICILNRYFNTTGEYPIMLLGLYYEPLKAYILKRCIHNEDNIKHQVRTLFEEG